ncbi:MAG: hypothetical protein AAF825_10465 [Pseudomonadota bacterium]
MLFSFLATVFAGFAGAGVAMILRLVFKDRMPGWSVPAAAGTMMLLANISSEYNWYNGTVSALESGFEVVETRQVTSWYRPWTYLRPFTNSFVAVHPGSVQSNDEVPGLRLMSAFIFERWSPQIEMAMLIDCDQSRRADLIGNVSFDEDGRPINAPWRDVADDDPFLQFACQDFG